MIATSVNLFVLSLLAISAPITSSMEVLPSKNEGVKLERKETLGNAQLMSHEELITEMIEMRKELKSQNERLQLQEEKNENQEKKISFLESALSNSKKMDKENKALAHANTNQLLKTDIKRTKIDKKPNRVERKAPWLSQDNPDATIPYEEIATEKSSIYAGVHFFVQRNSPWTTEGAISFQIEKLNIGEAIDLSTGIFTAPQDGVYHFAFSGMMKSGTGRLYVLLRRNINETIAVAHGDVAANTKISPMISFTATVQLQKDDRIELYKTNTDGILYDSSFYSYTSYTGSLLSY